MTSAIAVDGELIIAENDNPEPLPMATRRRFVAGLICAPAVARYGSLMPVRGLIVPLRVHWRAEVISAPVWYSTGDSSLRFFLEELVPHFRSSGLPQRVTEYEVYVDD